MPAVPLGSVDVFHLRSDAGMRARGQGGNACALVAELEGRLDVARLERRLSEATLAMPELRWRLGRDARVQPVWRSGARPALRLASVPEALRLEAACATLDQGIDGRAPLRLELWRGEANDALALVWFHPLTDARGAARLLAWLGSDAPPPAHRFRSADTLLERLDGDERRALGSAYVQQVLALARVPTVSPFGASRARLAGATTAVRVRLSPERTQAFDRSVRQRAKLAETSVVLLAAARLCDRVLAERRYAPPQLIVPVPVSLDPKDERERLFGNYLTMMMATVSRAALADETQAFASLAAQRREIARAKLDLGMIAALARARWLPGPLYRFVERRPFPGDSTSLVVSNVGELGVERMFGARVLDAYAVPAVTAPPGLQAIATRHAGSLSVVLVAASSAVSASELRAEVAAFERDLLPQA